MTNNESDFLLAQHYNAVTQQTTKYFGSVLYILCLLGTVMNIFVFLQRAYKCRPCSLYLLFASICDLTHLNAGALSNILQYGFFYDWTLGSSIYCPLKNYIVYVFTITSGTLTVFASLDRFLLSSDDSTRWTFSNRRVATIAIKVILIFWLIFSLPICFCSKRYPHPSNNEQLICANPSNQKVCFFTRLIYTCVFDGFLPPLLMMMFGILTFQNVRHLYRRSQSQRASRINQQITSMLILQSIKSFFASFPLTIFNCYWLYTKAQEKTSLHQAKENLLMQIAYLLFWSNYTSFFVYIYSSDIFRYQWIKAMKKLFCCRYGNRRRQQLRRIGLKRLRLNQTIKQEQLSLKES